MTLGLESGTVSLLAAHEAWADAFELEKVRILAAIGNDIVAVEHVGSTSIPGVDAKPILDILVGVRRFEEAQTCVAPMQELGYVYRGEYGIPRRRYFVHGEPRTHHLHMVEVQSEQWQSMLKFRDLLRARSDLAAAYANSKRRLAEIYSQDRASYQREKGRVIGRMLAQC